VVAAALTPLALGVVLVLLARLALGVALAVAAEVLMRPVVTEKVLPEAAVWAY
jgi:hypothetical protein